jgi:membrane fusion protein (multidrug efflux system)
MKPSKFLVGFVVAALILSGCKQENKPELSAASPPQVVVAAVEQRDVPIVREWIGQLDGSENVDVRARVSGYIQEIAFKEGTVVKPGDLLLRIDPRPFAAAVAQEEADLAQATASQEKTELDEQRQKQLFDRKIASQQEYDNALKIVFAVSEKEYLAAAERLTAMLAQPLDQREAIGELIRADGKVHPYKGRFLAADRQVDPKTGTIRISALFPNPGNILRPGQYAKVRFKVQDRTGALLIPQRAVQELQGKNFVWVVDDANKVFQRGVTVGQRFGSDWVIEEGLKPGERIVVEGLQKVREGAPVQPLPAPPASQQTAKE